jgi:hypothetical protein
MPGAEVIRQLRGGSKGIGVEASHRSGSIGELAGSQRGEPLVVAHSFASLFGIAQAARRRDETAERDHTRGRKEGKIAITNGTTRDRPASFAAISGSGPAERLGCALTGARLTACRYLMDGREK